MFSFLSVRIGSRSDQCSRRSTLTCLIEGHKYVLLNKYPLQAKEEAKPQSPSKVNVLFYRSDSYAFRHHLGQCPAKHLFLPRKVPWLNCTAPTAWPLPGLIWGGILVAKHQKLSFLTQVLLFSVPTWKFTT